MSDELVFVEGHDSGVEWIDFPHLCPGEFYCAIARWYRLRHYAQAMARCYERYRNTKQAS